MNLSFFIKIDGRSLQLSLSFGKTFSYVRDACKCKDKVYQADIYRKNNTNTSCVFNGFKYIFRNSRGGTVQTELSCRSLQDPCLL